MRNHRGPVYFQREAKGCSLRHVDGYQIVVLSWMDAAHLLWDLKDALRADSSGRRCIDAVHASRCRENASAPHPKARR
jgi:hypothetical protein